MSVHSKQIGRDKTEVIRLKGAGMGSFYLVGIELSIWEDEKVLAIASGDS